MYLIGFGGDVVSENTITNIDHICSWRMYTNWHKSWVWKPSIIREQSFITKGGGWKMGVVGYCNLGKVIGGGGVNFFHYVLSQFHHTLPSGNKCLLPYMHSSKEFISMPMCSSLHLSWPYSVLHFNLA